MTQNEKIKIGNSLKRFRKEFGLTQDDIAKALNIHRPHYTNYENDKNMPGADMIIKIAIAFNVATDYLLGLTDEPRPKSQEVRDKEFFECVQNHTLAVLAALRKAGGVEVDKATAAVSVEQD